jgi:hypothetical protein
MQWGIAVVSCTAERTVEVQELLVITVKVSAFVII